MYGSTNGVSIVTVTTASQFGTATELQNILNVNLISGSVSTPSDAYEAMATAIETYQFRNDVDKKIVLITDRVSYPFNYLNYVLSKYIATRNIIHLTSLTDN